MIRDYYRMSLASPVQLTDAQIDAVATAIDACAAIAAYSNQEAALQIFMEGLSFEFGENQAQRIKSRAPRFSSAISGENRPKPVASALPYTAMSLARNRAVDEANKSLTKAQITEAVKAVQH